MDKGSNYFSSSFKTKWVYLFEKKICSWNFHNGMADSDMSEHNSMYISGHSADWTPIFVTYNNLECNLFPALLIKLYILGLLVNYKTKSICKTEHRKYNLEIEIEMTKQFGLVTS